jgi:hypothetical protein
VKCNYGARIAYLPMGIGHKPKSSGEGGKTMKAVLLMNHGGPEMLPYGEAPDPTAGPGEILVGAAGMAQSYMDRGPYEIRTADQLVFQKRCLRSSLAGSPRRCRLRHCPTTSGVTPDEFVSAVDITAELCLRVYLGPPIAASTRSWHRINCKNDWQSTNPLLTKHRAQPRS